MKKNALTVAIFASFMAFSANANSEAKTSSANRYQHEANVTLSTHTDDFGDGLWNLNYRYYLHPVNIENGPYALNGFIAQESNIGAQYTQMNNYSDNDMYSIHGSYVFDSKWFIGANYQKINIDNDWSIYSFDENRYGINLGYYFNSSSEVSVFYQRSDSSDSYDGRYNATVIDGPVFKSSSFEKDDSNYGVNLHSFIPLQAISGIELLANWTHSSSHATNKTIFDPGSRVYTSDSDNDQILIAADVYINQSWSIGADYLWEDWYAEYKDPDDIYSQTISDSSNSFYSLNTAYWWQITENFAANFKVAKQFGIGDAYTPDGVLIGITANARF
ncbi:putative porin [Shewanella atlantica]|uniref:Porin n=1 Tax=Shewanella atlantica TaxID=271099 RepID=A0A431W0E0_9GAMM|nr:putative porin [Shewanella atlantica]RTR28865.1 hypothetical protein EKG39_17955 [Shewanella atlantica]